ncbi:hypothetical protein AVEN_55306-1 [Araneus ventricosus]|uniref:Uncharacterized protein n=1 Tax=Araneus ventricosus TaxID=182803 RepID=A0A4Y2D6Y6_ARAVE|nr:hypothetical protein AVEN_55306-1 [Araneus ventricosus]
MQVPLCLKQHSHADLTKNVDAAGESSVCSLVHRDKVRCSNATKLSDTIWHGTTVPTNYALVPEAAVPCRHKDLTSYARLRALLNLAFLILWSQYALILWDFLLAPAIPCPSWRLKQMGNPPLVYGEHYPFT